MRTTPVPRHPCMTSSSVFLCLTTRISRWKKIRLRGAYYTKRKKRGRGRERERESAREWNRRKKNQNWEGEVMHTDFPPKLSIGHKVHYVEHIEVEPFYSFGLLIKLLFYSTSNFHSRIKKEWFRHLDIWAEDFFSIFHPLHSNG